ncbi:MAG: restriction endonuclease subunit S [Bacteroidetes bacterium]|nr:restriction endonuclease subunit S [Bacteroidota bacterium]
MRKEKIGNIFLSIRNGANIQQDKIADGVPITRIETIADGTIDLNRLGYANVKDDSFKDYYLKEGDILMSHINSELHLGKVAYYDIKNIDIIHGMNLLCLKADRYVLYPKYAFYYFRTPYFKSRLKRITKKSVNQASFNISSLLSLDIPIPDNYDDQKRIATILGKAEKLIAQRKETIKLLDEFLKSIFLDMFGDPVRNEKGWEKRKLGNLTEIGTGATPSRQNESLYYNGKHNWVKTTEVDWGYIYDTEEKITDLALKETNCKLYNPDTVLLAMYGQGITRGKVALLKTIASTNQACAAILPSRYFNPNFLFHLLINSYKKLRSLGRGGNQENLNLTIVGEYNVILPDIDLQNKFASIVEKTEALKQQYNASLQELENLYGSLSQRAFKGELDLSKVPIEEEPNNFSGPAAPEEDKRYGDPFEGMELPKEGLISRDEIHKLIGHDWEEIQEAVKGSLAPIEKQREDSQANKTIEIVSDLPIDNIKPIKGKKAIVKSLDSLFFAELDIDAIRNILNSKYKDKYFSFSDLKFAVAKRYEYQYEVLKNIVFDMLRQKILKQVFVDKNHNESVAEFGYINNQVLTKNLNDGMYFVTINTNI